MQSLNPHGQLKDISVLVGRELKPFELDYLNNCLVRPMQVTAIYETLDSNWNLIEINKSYFVSMPKIKGSCSPSIYGSKEHALKYNIFK